MAAQLHNTTTVRPFVDGVYIMRPRQLKTYFLQEQTLQIPPNHTLYFWMNEQPSSEWSKNTPPDLEKVLRVFNEYLNPIGKSCNLVTNSNETIKIEALDDGIKLSTAAHGFKVVLI